MKAFVTGGTGFVGTHVIEELERGGWEIVALHRSSSDLSNLERVRSIELTVGDITDIASLRRGMPEGVDAVFHIAGSAGTLPHSQEHTRYGVNHEGTRNVVAVCKEKKIGRLVHTSTIATYDYLAAQPLTEDSPANDWSRDPYIHSKRLAEIEVERGAADGLDVVYVHPCAILGKYDKDTWSKAFKELERGLPLPVSPPGGINVCHARRVAEAHVAAFHRGRRDRHYIVGGPAVTFLELFQNIAKVIQRPGPRVALPAALFKLFGWTEFGISSLLKREPTFTPHTIDLLSVPMYSATTRAVEELGYQPSTVQEAIVSCYEWMLETGMLSARQPRTES
jgi:nucleoside-diphosphate-sugar epimerase